MEGISFTPPDALEMVKDRARALGEHVEAHERDLAPTVLARMQAELDFLALLVEQLILERHQLADFQDRLADYTRRVNQLLDA
jgi:hypothetical protein